MNIKIHEQASVDQSSESPIGLRRMWSAVLLQALEDWQSTSLTRKLQAEKFLFQSQNDLASVCRSAGLDPRYVAAKLERMKQSAQQQPAHFAWQAA